MRYEIYSFDDRTHRLHYVPKSTRKAFVKEDQLILNLLKKLINQSSKQPKKIKSKLFNPIIEMSSFKIQRGSISI